MILKLLSIIAITVLVDASLESRVEPKLACNCKLNEYARDEAQLGYEYLDMSNYMAHDRVAFYGFHKMFRAYWKEQWDNRNKVFEYAIKRGDEPKILNMLKLNIRSKLNNTGSLHAVKLTLENLLFEEKRLNGDLLKLSKCSTDKMFQEKQDKVCRKPPSEEEYNVDPMLANFIEANFLTQKVERIKFLADLIERLSKFDVHVSKTPHQHQVIPLGVHLLDKELMEKF